MNKNLKKLTAICAVLTAAVAAYLSVATFEIPSFGKKIESALEARTGLDLKFERMTLKLLPHPTARITGVTVYKNEEPLFRAGILDTRLSLSSLLTGTIQFKDIILEDAELNISLNRGGAEAARADATKTTLLQKIPVIANLVIKNSVVKLDSPLPATSDSNHPNQMVLSIDIAYLNEVKGRTSYGIEGRMKNGPSISITGDAGDKFNEVAGLADIRGLSTDLLSSYLGRSCGCAAIKGKIDVELSYAINGSGVAIKAEKIILKTTEFSIKAHGDYNFKKAADDATLTIAASSGKIPIAAIMKTLPLELFPKSVSKPMQKLVALSGYIEIGSIALSGPLKSIKNKSFYKAMTLNVSVSGLSFAYPGVGQSISALSGSIAFKDNNLTLKDFSARIGAGRIEALNAQISDPAYKARYIASIKASIQADDALKLAHAAARSNPKISALIEKLRAAGQIDASINASGTAARLAMPDTLFGRAAIKVANISHSATGLRADSITGYADFTEKKIVIGELTAAHGSSRINLNGEVSEYATKDPSYELSISGELDSESLDLLSRAASPILRDISAPIKLGARAKKNKGNFTVYASVDTASLQDYRRESLNEITDENSADNPDNSAGKALEAIGAELFIKRAPENGEDTAPTTGSLKIKRASIKGHKISDLTATLKIDSDKMEFSPLVAIADGGSLSAQLTYYREAKNPLLFKLDAAISDARLENIIAAAGARSKVLVGPLSGRVDLEGRRVDGEFPRGVDGRVSLTSEKGSLRKFVALNKMLAIVNIISVNELFEEGFPYKKLAGDFTFENGIISTENLFFDGSSMRMSATGSIDPVLATINCHIGMHPFVTFDRVVSAVPVANLLLLGTDGVSASLYYELTGPLREMSVKPLALRSEKDTSLIGLKRQSGERPGRTAPENGVEKNPSAK